MIFPAKRHARRVWLLIAFAASPCLAKDWKSPAQLHETLKKPHHGTFLLTEDGAEFHSPKLSRQWRWTDILTFDLSSPTELTITSYENRPLHEPGNRRFHLTLAQPMPPDVAARFAAFVERPVINGAPPSGVPTVAEIPAHRRGRFGGSNGSLRFRDEGIDYVTPSARDARTWRWSDLQTIANPNRWEFRLTGWREIAEFDLKQPMPPALFDRLWNHLYQSDLNLAPRSEGYRQ